MKMFILQCILNEENNIIKLYICFIYIYFFFFFNLLYIFIYKVEFLQVYLKVL